MTSDSSAPTTPLRSPRLDWIDTARGVSIGLIVLMHTRVVLGGVGVPAEAVARVDDIAGHLRIPLFFAASGLFAARWATASWAELFRGRLALLIWVFVMWQPVVLAYKLAEWWLLRDELAEQWGWQVGQMLLSAVRPVGELWFLWALVVFLALAKLTARVPSVWRIGVPAAVSLVWVAIIEPELGADVSEALGAGWGGVAKYFVFFIVAAAFSTPIRAFYSAMPRWVAAAVVVGWVVLTVAAIDGDIRVEWVRPVLFALGAAAGFALGRLLEPMRVFRMLGRNTLPVYVAHLPIIVALVIVLHLLSAPAVLAQLPTVSVVVLASAAVAGALLMHRALVRTRAGRLLYAPPAWLQALGAGDGAAPAANGAPARAGRSDRG